MRRLNPGPVTQAPSELSVAEEHPELPPLIFQDACGALSTRETLAQNTS